MERVGCCRATLEELWQGFKLGRGCGVGEKGGWRRPLQECRREAGGHCEVGTRRTHPVLAEVGRSGRLQPVPGPRKQGGLRQEVLVVGRLEVRGWVEGLTETGSRGAGHGCHTPMCPRSLLEEECHTLERMIPVLQVSSSPGPPCPEPFCRV